VGIGDCIQLVDGGSEASTRLVRCVKRRVCESDRKTFFLDALSNPFRSMGFLSLTIEPPLSMMTCFWVLRPGFSAGEGSEWVG